MTKQEILRQIETILDNAYDSEDLSIKFSFQKLEGKKQKSKFTFLLDGEPKKTNKERLSEEMEKFLELYKNEKRGEIPQPSQLYEPFQSTAPFYKMICGGSGIAVCDDRRYFQDYNNTDFVKGYNYP